MNGRERFMAALLRRGEPDRVPLWELIVNEPTLSAFGATSPVEFVEMEDLDGITVFEDGRVTPLTEAERRELSDRAGSPIDPAHAVFRNEWGSVWGAAKGHPAYPIGGPISGPDDLKGYRPPDPEAAHRLESLREAVARFKGTRAVVFLVHDAFEFPHYLRGGMGNLLTDYVEEPALAHALAELAIDFKIRLMRRAVAEGAEAIVSGDDYATPGGPLMSPAHFREFILPYLKRLVDATHAAGVPFIKHTDGNLWPILDDIVGAGIDALDPIEPAAGMDIREVKRTYGDRIAVMGNVDCSFVLPGATPSDVEDAVKETIAKASPGGGHILASSNSIHPGVAPANYRAMTSAARAFGRYPIDAGLVRDYEMRNYIARYRPTG